MHIKIEDKLPILVWNTRQRKLLALLLILFLMLTMVIGCASPGSHDTQTDPVDDAEATAGRSAEDLDPDLLFHALAAERMGAAGDLEQALEHALSAAEISDNPDLARQAVSLAMQLEDWDAMEQAAARWLELDSESSAAFQLLVLSEVNSGQFERAARRLADQVGRAADPADGWREAALLLASAAEASSALTTMDAVVERLGPDESEQSLESRSLLLWQLGRSDEALTLARQAVEMEPTPGRLVWAAQLAAANDDLDGALEYYRQARRLDPDDNDLALAEAEVLRLLERNDEALDVLSAQPADTGVLYTLGLYHVESGELEEARQVWTRLASIEAPDDPLEHAYLTGFLAELADLDSEALDWYQRVESGPNANRALLHRAGLEGQQGNLMEARNLLRAVRLGDDADLIEQSWLTEADLLREAERPAECVELLTGVLRDRPESIWLLYTRAICAVDNDDLELAEQDLRRIIQIDGDNAMALNALGYTLTDLTSRHNEALRLIERALELEPEDPAVLDSMGWVKFRLGQPEQALGYLEDAFELDENPEIGAHLAEVLWVLQRRDESRELIGRLLDQYPDDRLLRDTRDRLESASE